MLVFSLSLLLYFLLAIHLRIKIIFKSPKGSHRHGNMRKKHKSVTVSEMLGLITRRKSNSRVCCSTNNKVTLKGLAQALLIQKG